MSPDTPTSTFRSFRAGLLVGGAVGVVGAGAVYRRELASMVAGLRPHDRTPARVTKPVLIINRWSGGGKAEQWGLAAAAKEHGIETVMLERDDDLVALAEDAVAEGADAIGMAGGDGSLGLVAGVAAEHDLPFFCVPVGTRNHFALDLGLDRDDPLAALTAVQDGIAIAIDHGAINDRVFLNNVSLGLYPQAVKRDGYRDARAATMFSVASESASAGVDGAALRFATPDGLFDGETPMVLISNNPYVMTGPPDFGRRIRLDAGRLGIMAVVPSTGGSATSVSASVPRSWTAPDLFVESALDAVDVGIDGESVLLPPPLDVSIRSRTLQVLVPAGTRPGYRPSPRRRRVVLEHILDLFGESDA